MPNSGTGIVIETPISGSDNAYFSVFPLSGSDKAHMSPIFRYPVPVKYISREFRYPVPIKFDAKFRFRQGKIAIFRFRQNPFGPLLLLLLIIILL